MDRLEKTPALVSPAWRPLAILAVGLGLGGATSLLQAVLSEPWLSLVDSAAPWLSAMFLAGTFSRGPGRAVLSGVGTGLLELLGYYLAAAVKGYSASDALMLFWAVCAVLGGPIFGAGGWLWWRHPGHFGSLGAALLPGAFLAEAGLTYALQLHHLGTALLFALIALGLFAVLGLRRRQHRPIALWLAFTLPLGALAELVLGVIYP